MGHHLDHYEKICRNNAGQRLHCVLSWCMRQLRVEHAAFCRSLREALKTYAALSPLLTSRSTAIFWLLHLLICLPKIGANRVLWETAWYVTCRGSIKSRSKEKKEGQKEIETIGWLILRWKAKGHSEHVVQVWNEPQTTKQMPLILK